jgi:hypothetical protein
LLIQLSLSVTCADAPPCRHKDFYLSIHIQKDYQYLVMSYLQKAIIVRGDNSIIKKLGPYGISHNFELLSPESQDPAQRGHQRHLPAHVWLEAINKGLSLFLWLDPAM